MLGTFAPIPETPIAIGPFSTRLPRLQTLSDEEAEAYWDGLGRAGLRQRYGDTEMEHQYGTSFDLSPALAGYLVGAVRRLDALLKRYIREAGGLTSWLRERAPVLGSTRLSFEAVNKPLEARLLGAEPGQRTVLPFSLDVILTTKGEAASLRVVELQTGLGYAKILWRQLEALGHDASAATSWAGSAAPGDVLGAVCRDGAGRGDDAVSLLATFPSLTQNLRDEAGFAGYFSSDGAPRGFFLATDLERDAEGWFHLEYEIDPATGLPRLDSEDRPVRTLPARKRRIRRVVTMQTQLEIDHIYARLGPEARTRFEAFVADGERVTWLFPNAAWYIADKSLMARFRVDLLAEGDPRAELFTPCFGPSEVVAGPGAYVVKPIRGVGGKGLRSLTLAGGERFEVPSDHIAHERFSPLPYPVRLSPRLEGAFPLPPGAPGRAEHVADPRFTTATLELRVFSLPGSTERDDAYVFMARAAPTWDPLDDAPTAPVLTNLSKIQRAIERSPRVTRDNHRLLPFGWCAVTNGAS